MSAANSSSNAPWNGRFVWHDLMTKDGKKAADFYSALFGWQIEERDMQGCTYRMIIAGPGPIGGIVEEQNIPAAHWMPYIATPDVDKSAAQCKELGGTVCVGPMDIPNTGRFAVVGDPSGGYFSLFRGLPGSQGFDPDQPVAGRVCWNELLTTDFAAAQSFYSAMFGWTVDAKDMGEMGTYNCQVLGDKQAAGMMKHPQPGAPSMWLAYFLVPNLAQATEKAKSLQATPMMENVPIPEVGAFSMFVDPTGAVFALFETNPAHLQNKATQQPAQSTAKSAAKKPAPAKKVVVKATTKPTAKVMAKAATKPTSKPMAKVTAKSSTKNGKTAVLKAQPKTKAMASKPPKKPTKKLVAKAAPKKTLAAKKPAAKTMAAKKVLAKKPMAKPAVKAKAKVTAKGKR